MSFGCNYSDKNCFQKDYQVPSNIENENKAKERSLIITISSNVQLYFINILRLCL